MNEPEALKVAAVRAAETAESLRTAWSDADRAWASRAAAEVVGERGTPDAFVARRAALALERLGARAGDLPRAVATLTWRPWVGAALVVASFAAGMLVDRIGGEQRINLLAPPVIALLAWNVGVYLFLLGRIVVGYGEPAKPGLLRRSLLRAAGGVARADPRAHGDAVSAFAGEWSQLAAPLYRARAARILHLAATALALGVIAGLYLRGIGLEYRASWSSTFLDAPAVRTILATLYAPGAAVTGLAVPGVDAIAAIRAPASENAASWLHLIAATLLVVAALPRLALAIGSGWLESSRAKRMPVPLDRPYFQRLLRGFRGGPARVRVLPYSYTVPAASLAGLERVVARTFGGGASMHTSAPLAYGAPDPPALADGDTTLVLFNATSTPEAEVHGACLASLRARGLAPIALLDTSALVAARAGDAAGVEARVEAWRAATRDAGVALVVANLADPDLADIDEAIDAALDEQST